MLVPVDKYAMSICLILATYAGAAKIQIPSVGQPGRIPSQQDYGISPIVCAALS
jgi:hypothetical protein